MGQRSITAEDFYRFRWVGDPHVSPDGQRIAYVLKTVDKETNEYRTAIWMAPVSGGLGAAYQFTADGSDPRWSPDGQWIAFVSDRAGTMPDPNEDESPAERDKRLGKDRGQIWVIPAQGGEARQVTFLKYGAGDPVWSPDGKTLLFSAKTGDLPEIAEHDGKKEPRSHHIKEIVYRFNGAGNIYEQRSHLFVVLAAGGEPKQLTDGDWNDGAPAWSPDGSQIAFNSDRGPNRWRREQSELWLMNADGSNPQKLLGDDEHYFYNVSWSPDGKHLAFLGSQLNDGQHDDVFVMPMDSREPRKLTQSYHMSFSDTIGGDMRNDHPDSTPRWSPDSQTLFVIGDSRGAGNVYALNVADGALCEVTTGQHHILGYSLDHTANTLALAIGDTQQPGDIFAQWRDSGNQQRLTEVNKDFLGELRLSEPEEFTFKSKDGWEIEGWILKPHNFDPNQKYPMILEVHGGPTTEYGYTFHQEFQILAGKGFVVLYTNPRGSTGYGRDFAHAVEGHWGEMDYEDVMAGVDAVIARGYVDPNRLGVTGGSYGGFMTNWVIGHTNRFSAAVTQRCVSNLASMFGTSDVCAGWFSEMYGTPWENPEVYAKHSPITYVANMQTPLLIEHEEEDWRCPIEQAEQLFTALKWRGVEVEFIRYERQNHDLSRNGHPKLRIERLNAIVNWFTSHIPTTPGASSADQAASEPVAATVADGHVKNGHAEAEAVGDLSALAPAPHPEI